MNIFTIPMRNLRRKMLRTTALTLVFTAGILSVVMLYYVSHTVGHKMEEKLTQFGANIVVAPKSDTLNVTYGGFTLSNLSYHLQYLSEKEVMNGVRTIKNKENISVVAPKLIEAGKLGERPVAVVGVLPQEEEKIKSYWHLASGNRLVHEGDVTVGANVANRYGVKVGDSITLGSSSITVTGILEPTGAEDDNLVFAHLHTVQKLTGKPDSVTFVEVAALCAGCPIEDIVKQIQQKLPNSEITALQQVVKQRMFAIEFVQHLVMGVSLVILIIACFMLAMFMLTSVNERKKEIGILRSMGYSAQKIFAIFSFEALLIGAASGALGYLAGIFGSVKLLAVLEMAEGATVPFSAVHFALTIAAVSLLSITAAAVPALKAAKIQPTDAIVQL